MKKKIQTAKPKEGRGAVQLKATISRITAALQVLLLSGKRFEKISHLADEVAGICNIHRSLLLRKDKSYRKCLDSFPTLVGDETTPSTPYSVEIDPLHPIMIRNSELERENVRLRNIVDDLSKRPSMAVRPQGTAPKAGKAPEYQRQFELTCQLVDKILEHKRAIRIIDNTLTDLSDISGIPKPVADSKLTNPYVTWKNACDRI
ncbi:MULTISPECIES: hypothetical protein [unclassified Pseudomonas]|uniref:hypothetical protein n=1 Tax=unclassified Pseudomonas TaxID=196821 RepID=UPI000CCFF229|nr:MULTISPECIES: hypothetical protein [unclassified Pseudomonas]POA28213.1 hypothetical protein C1887_24815 [Pseudomonas sp. GW456-R21]POA62152.1 hypothetical protein C1884_27510 [Pseudomonas sp. GW460-R15]